MFRKHITIATNISSQKKIDRDVVPEFSSALRVDGSAGDIPIRDLHRVGVEVKPVESR